MNPWEKIDKLMKHAAEPKGPEWFTKRQFMEHYGVSGSCADNRIAKMMSDGLLEKWTGTLPSKRVGNKWKLK